MAGKIYVMAENFYDPDSDVKNDDTLIDYIEHRSVDSWFFSKKSCEDYINSDHMKLESEAYNSEFECVDICFCKYYWVRIFRALKKRELKSAIKFFIAGFRRMIRNFKEK